MAITITYINPPGHVPTVAEAATHDWNGFTLVADIDVANGDGSADVVVIHNLNLPPAVQPFVTLTPRLVVSSTQGLSFCVTNFGANDITVRVDNRDTVAGGVRVYITRPTP